jgi:two-component system chemotaxis sensor kinase CheA
LNGTIVVDSEKGKGTRFLITLPLTLAIVPTLLVMVGGSTFAVPLITVSSTLRILKSELKTVNRVPVIQLRDRVLPLLNLSEVFRIKSDVEDEQYHHVVVVGSGQYQMGLIVDRLLGQEEVVVKSMGPLVGDIYGIASAAILGDGKVILIIDVQDLYRLSTTSKMN